MLAILEEVELFWSMPREVLREICSTSRPRTLKAGSQLHRHGDVYHSMFVIVSGRVQVVRCHPDLSVPIDLVDVGPGETVGETGFFDGECSATSVTAVEETRVLEISAACLARTLLRYPTQSSSVLSIVSRRVKSFEDLERLANQEGWVPAE